MKKDSIRWKLDRYTHNGIIYADHTTKNILEDLSNQITVTKPSKLIIDTKGVKDIDDAVSIDIWQCVSKKFDNSNLKTIALETEQQSLANFSLLSAYEKVNLLDHDINNKFSLIFK